MEKCAEQMRRRPPPLKEKRPDESYEDRNGGSRMDETSTEDAAAGTHLGL